MLNRKHRGFTLVELLIVIVVVGVLAAMMLSSTEAVSSARANNIISNLRNIKTAALAFYVDNLDAIVVDGSNTKLNPSKIADIGTDGINWFGDIVKAHKSIIKKYLGDNGNLSLNDEVSNKNYCKEGGYVVRCADNGKTWYVVYRFASGETSIRGKVASRASSLGLFGLNDTSTNSLTAASHTYNKHAYVFVNYPSLKALGFLLHRRILAHVAVPASSRLFALCSGETTSL